MTMSATRSPRRSSTHAAARPDAVTVSHVDRSVRSRCGGATLQLDGAADSWPRSRSASRAATASMSSTQASWPTIGRVLPAVPAAGGARTAARRTSARAGRLAGSRGQRRRARWPGGRERARRCARPGRRCCPAWRAQVADRAPASQASKATSTARRVRATGERPTASKRSPASDRLGQQPRADRRARHLAGSRSEMLVGRR